MKQFILDNPVESILLVVLLCILLGVIIYCLYKRFYDHQLNLVLQRKKKIHLLSPHSVAWIWIGCSLLLVVIVISMIFFVPKDEGDNYDCEVINDSITYVEDEEDVEEILDSLKEKSKSLSIQMEHPNPQVSVLYAVNDKGNYLYSIVYDLERMPDENENFIIRIMNDTGWTGFETKATSQKIILVIEGESNPKCEAEHKKIHIYNYVKGENKNKIDYYDEFTIEKGGITR